MSATVGATSGAAGPSAPQHGSAAAGASATADAAPAIGAAAQATACAATLPGAGASAMPAAGAATAHGAGGTAAPAAATASAPAAGGASPPRTRLSWMQRAINVVPGLSPFGRSSRAPAPPRKQYCGWLAWALSLRGKKVDYYYVDNCCSERAGIAGAIPSLECPPTQHGVPLPRLPKPVIVLIDALDNVAAACAFLAAHRVLGFDVEWYAPQQKGVAPHPVSVLQLAVPGSNHVYIFHLKKLRSKPRSAGGKFGLPAPLTALLLNNTVLKAGVCISGDFTRLEKQYDFGSARLRHASSGMVDIADLVRQRYADLAVGNGLKQLTEAILGMYITKDKATQMSNWDVTDLTKPQLQYAADDALATLLLYEVCPTRSVHSLRCHVPVAARAALKVHASLTACVIAGAYQSRARATSGRIRLRGPRLRRWQLQRHRSAYFAAVGEREVVRRHREVLRSPRSHVQGCF